LGKLEDRLIFRFICGPVLDPELDDQEDETCPRDSGCALDLTLPKKKKTGRTGELIPGQKEGEAFFAQPRS
jgi:hypothetical protein